MGNRYYLLHVNRPIFWAPVGTVDPSRFYIIQQLNQHRSLSALYGQRSVSPLRMQPIKGRFNFAMGKEVQRHELPESTITKNLEVEEFSTRIKLKQYILANTTLMNFYHDKEQWDPTLWSGERYIGSNGTRTQKWQWHYRTPPLKLTRQLSQSQGRILQHCNCKEEFVIYFIL